VIWEDCNRPTRTIYVQVDEAFAADLTPNPHAFLTACVVPAMHHGEQRVRIDEPICPELRNGLLTSLGWLSHWYGGQRRVPSIEASSHIRLPHKLHPERAASFLSGGIDSLATLRKNRLDFPLEHPRSIKDCLMVYGFDIGAIETQPSEIQIFERSKASLTPLVVDAQATLIPVATNIRHLYDSVEFWIDEFFGAALAAVAHAFDRRISTMYIASGLDIAHVQPHGSNPMLDPNYSSTDLQIRHDNVRYTRLEKVKIVAEWDKALQNLRVCTMNSPDQINCGECEKCIRTMTELLAVGKLSQTRAFPVNDVSVELLHTLTFHTAYQEDFFRELIAPLATQGRYDLIRVIETKSQQYQKHLVWEEERDWKGTMKRFDRKYLGSRMYNSYKALRAGLKKHGVIQ
jgi:hypothetical protein